MAYHKKFDFRCTLYSVMSLTIIAYSMALGMSIVKQSSKWVYHICDFLSSRKDFNCKKRKKKKEKMHGYSFCIHYMDDKKII